jgi:hypothetical protein
MSGRSVLKSVAEYVLVHPVGANSKLTVTSVIAEALSNIALRKWPAIHVSNLGGNFGPVALRVRDVGVGRIRRRQRCSYRRRSIQIVTHFFRIPATFGGPQLSPTNVASFTYTHPWGWIFWHKPPAPAGPSAVS